MRRLLTIPISHFCEKARWALDRAGLEYVEERHIQGIHQIYAKRAGGLKTMPVLIAREGVFNQSESILRYADERVGEEQRLFPEDPALLAEIESLCRKLDEGLGPEGRRWIYAQVLPLKDLMLDYNNQGVPRWEDRFMRMFWPLAKGFASRELKITDTTIEDDGPRVWRALDEIAELLSDGRRYLCGDRFSAADLTFAALAASVVIPPEYGTPLPQPEDVPDELAREVRAFREHPAGAYAMELFRTERAR